MIVFEESFHRPPMCIWMCFLDHIPDDFRNKLGAKSHSCITMGYSEESKYDCLILSNEKSLSEVMFGLMKILLELIC
jgi:hypothetical protein